MGNWGIGLLHGDQALDRLLGVESYLDEKLAHDNTTDEGMGNVLAAIYIVTNAPRLGTDGFRVKLAIQLKNYLNWLFDTGMLNGTPLSTAPCNDTHDTYDLNSLLSAFHDLVTVETYETTYTVATLETSVERDKDGNALPETHPTGTPMFRIAIDHKPLAEMMSNGWEFYRDSSQYIR